MTHTHLFLLLLFFSPPLPAQPSIEWQKCLGGSNVEEAQSIQQTTDGGYILTGTSLSSNGDVSINYGVSDFWVVKLNSVGGIQWQKSYGGSNHDRPYSIQQTNDGGYIVVGETESDDGDVTGYHGGKDCWVLKINSTGGIQWEKTLGGSEWDKAWSVQQTTDGGYVVMGHSNSLDGDVTGNHGALDFWVVKLRETGAIEWEKSLGGSLNDYGYSIHQTHDGGYIAAGEANSNNGDLTGAHGSADYWVVKLNDKGDLEWQKALGSTSLDRANDVYPTSDGGYIVFGQTSANNGDVTGHHGGYDYWAVKLNNLGEIQWQKALGGSGEEFAFSIEQTEDGGYVMTGFTQSTDGDVLDNDGGQDIWLVKLTPAGEIHWSKSIGGTQAERAYDIQQTSDGGYAVCGYTKSNDGDVSGFHGVQDFWVVKLSPEAVNTSEAPSSSPLELYPNPASESVTIKVASEVATLSVSVRDYLGREMRHQVISNGGNLELGTLATGLYFVVATEASGKAYFGKVWKE